VSRKVLFVFVLVLLVIVACGPTSVASEPSKDDATVEPTIAPAEVIEAKPTAIPVVHTIKEEKTDDNVEVITRTYIDDVCPEVNEYVGGLAPNWRRIDTIFNDELSTAEDGCGWRLFDFNNVSMVLDIPEGWHVNKPPKTLGPAVIRTYNEPVTLWLPDYSDGCPAPTEMALGTEESDWTRFDANNDGKINIDDDWCGYLLTSWDSKNLKFNIPEGIEADQSVVVNGPATYDTNRLEASVWIVDLDSYIEK